MSVTREVMWGDALMVQLFRAVGGLKAVVDAIQRELGPTIGSRNTFAKLLRVDDPADLNGKDQWRAWLLLTALGQDPDDWGLGTVQIPSSVEPEALIQRLQVPPVGLEPTTCGLKVRSSTN